MDLFYAVVRLPTFSSTASYETSLRSVAWISAETPVSVRRSASFDDA